MDLCVGRNTYSPEKLIIGYSLTSRIEQDTFHSLLCQKDAMVTYLLSAHDASRRKTVILTAYLNNRTGLLFRTYAYPYQIAVRGGAANRIVENDQHE